MSADIGKLVERLRKPIDHSFEELIAERKEAADALERMRRENARLADALSQALRQWKMYAESTEGRDDFDFEKEESAEANIYRDCRSALHARDTG